MLYYHRYIFMSRFLYKDNIKYNDLNFYFIKFDCLKKTKIAHSSSGKNFHISYYNY